MLIKKYHKVERFHGFSNVDYIEIYHNRVDA